MRRKLLALYNSRIFPSFLVLTSLYLLILSVEVIVAFYHTQRQTNTLVRNAWDEGWGRRRDLYLTHATFTSDRGIQTRNPSKRAASVPRLKPRGHRDRLTQESANINNVTLYNTALTNCSTCLTPCTVTTEVLCISHNLHNKKRLFP
jgi:hypothetical protein